MGQLIWNVSTAFLFYFFIIIFYIEYKVATQQKCP